MIVTIDIILKWCGAIGVIAVAVKGLIYLFSPITSSKKMLLEHDQLLMEHDEYLKKDKENIDNLTSLMKDCMKLQLLLINHAIDGNGVARMKELRDEIQNKII